MNRQKRDYFIRGTRGADYEDIGRAEDGTPEMTEAEAKNWVNLFSVDGYVEARDGGAPFAVEVIHWG